MNVKQAVVARFCEIMKKRGMRPNELANLSGVTPSPFIACWTIAEKN